MQVAMGYKQLKTIVLMGTYIKYLIKYMFSIKLLATVLITLMYILAGFNKLTNFTKVSADFSTMWNISVCLAQLVILLVIVLEIVGPVVIITDKLNKFNLAQASKIACYMLAGFTVLATVMYHFPPTGDNYRPFLANLVATGAFLALAN